MNEMNTRRCNVHFKFWQSHDAHVNAYASPHWTLAFNFHSPAQFLWSFLPFSNHASVLTDTTSCFCSCASVHWYSMCVKLNSTITAKKIQLSLLLDSLLRASVIGTTSGVRFFDPSASFSWNLLLFECSDCLHRFFSANCWWWWQ